MCNRHYQKDRLGTLWNELIGYEFTCGCNKTTKNRTDCQYCYNRAYKQPIGTKGPYGPHVGDPNRYDQVHYELRRDRGPASDYNCDDDPTHAAAEWALIPGRESGQSWRNERWYDYSDNQDDYVPLCRKAHRVLDGVGSKGSPL